MNKELLNSFIDYCGSIFPNVDTQVEGSVKKALNQFDPDKFCWFSDYQIEGLCQGDIIDKITFAYYDDECNLFAYTTKAMIVSNSCDIENDDDILLAPLIDYKDSDELDRNQKQDILNNRYLGRMCFTNTSLDNYFVDFSRMQSFNKNFIVKLINSEKIKKECSLSQFAWYFLMVKLNIHFARMENHELFNSRPNGI